MISKQKISLIVIIVLLLAFILGNISRLIPESKNYQAYSEALRKYNNSAYSDAYSVFGKVSKFSKLKPAALYRQALCADKLGDTKTEIRKYKDIIRYYPNSTIGLKAKYLKAQHLYETKNFKKAKKEFTEIFGKNSRSDYGIAAQYYLGSIEVEHSSKMKSEKKKLKSQNKAIQYFKGYLKEAPTGRFAINCIQKWVSMNRKLNNEDNLVIAKVYLENADYKDALNYLKFTNLSLSWPYFVKDYYGLKDYSKVKYYTVLGLKNKVYDEVLINEDIDEKTENKNIYDAIDLYLKVSNSPRESLSYLLSISQLSSKGYDYLLFKDCNNMPAEHQAACFNTLYYKYPDGQFSAEALSNIFYEKIKSQQYTEAKQLGRKHLSTYPDANSTPKVMFWMAKIAQRTKNYDEARKYYKNLMSKYPDDYYSFHAFLNLNTLRRLEVVDLKEKPVEFPYKNYDYGIITELAKVKDYGLINQLYKDDDFIRSWLFYLQGDFSSSARIARDAMDKLPQKPVRLDPRWRLVYPIHYYDKIKQRAASWNNDSTLILSIIREESYFNPKAKSAVGARGLMQLMPATAVEAGKTIGFDASNINLLFDPDVNIRLGNIYYSQLRKNLFDRDILAVLAYNGGIGSVSRWRESLNYLDTDDFVEQIPYSETKNYLKKVYRSYWNYLRIYDGIRY